MFPLQIVVVILLFLSPNTSDGHPCPPTNGTANGTNPCVFPDPRFPYAFPPPHPQPYPNYPVNYAPNYPVNYAPNYAINYAPNYPVNYAPNSPLNYALNYQYPSHGFGPQSHVHWPQQPSIQRPGYSYPPNYSGPSQYYPRLPFYGYPLPHYSFSRRSGSLQEAAQATKPLYMDRATVQIINGRDAELTCSFTDPKYRVVSNIVWVKVTGPYDHFMPIPPFDCLTPGCQYEHINNAADFRFRVITIGPTSILHIYDFMHRDFGIYRCAATGTGSDGHTVTLYKIAEFLQPAPSKQYRPYR